MLSRRRQIITAIFAITSITIFIYQVIKASHTDVPIDLNEVSLRIPLFTQLIDASNTPGGGMCIPTTKFPVLCLFGGPVSHAPHGLESHPMHVLILCIVSLFLNVGMCTPADKSFSNSMVHSTQLETGRDTTQHHTCGTSRRKMREPVSTETSHSQQDSAHHPSELEKHSDKPFPSEDFDRC